MYFAKLNSFYITVLFIIALGFIYIVFCYTLIPLIKNVITKNNLIKCFKEKNTDYEVRKKASNEYDYSLIVNNQENFIKLIDIKKDSDIPNIYDFSDMNRAIWEIKPAHLGHEINLNNCRKLNIKTNYEDVKFKYIPCNTIYAGQTQPNTYVKDSELNYLPSSENVVIF